jgi:two-component system sensor histidine kinase HydH
VSYNISVSGYRYFLFVAGTAAFSAFCAFLIVRAMTHPIQELAQKAEKLIRFEESRKERGQMIELFQLMERLIEFVRSRETKPGEKKEILQEVEKLDYILPLGYMSLMVAHEVRNPLSTITGMAELLKGRMEERVREAYLDKILEASRTIERFTRELLDFTDDQVLKEHFDVCEVISDVKAALAMEFYGGRWEWAGEETCLYNGDREKIQQAIHNVMRNAVEFEKLVGPSGLVRVTVKKRDGHLEVSVYNRNSRIEEGDFGNIFKPFFTKKKGGWGIGLAIAKRNVEMHGGKMIVESGAEGTNFVMKLPLQTPNS